MGRRDKGRKVDGWLVLDKPVGMTSTEAVARVKRLFDAAKAGHAGTLDPLASGSLPIALGEATKTVANVMDGRKLYRFTVRWGEETATDDAEGAAVNTSDVRPDKDQIRAVLPEFTGRIMQVPPRFSAVKIAGERAYDLAREGETVDAGGARDRGPQARSARMPGPRPRRFRGRMRQGRLCAGAGARHGPPPRHIRPRRGVAAPERRPIRRRADDFAGKARRVAR